MIAFLEGILEQIDNKEIVVNVGGVGYQVFVPSSVLSSLPLKGSKIKIYTSLIIREDSHSLYGFMSKEEKSLFSILISVSGIGPKVALGMLSSFPADKLAAAISKADVPLLTTMPGIGSKTAQRLVVELKEKVAKEYSLESTDITGILPGNEAAFKDAMSALISLGYGSKEAKDALMKIDLSNGKDIEQIIKESLKSMS